MFIVDTLIPIFVQTVLPVFLVAGAGVLLAWRLPMDGKTIGRLLFYLATPALVFRGMYQMEIDLQALGQLALVAGLVTVLSGVLGWFVGVGLDRRRRAAIVLTSAAANNGNMGIPISLFAFGQLGLVYGTISYVISSFLSNTMGAVVASAGEAPISSAIKNSLQVPVLYAAILGLLANNTGYELPAPLFRAIDLLAGAAIPGMLVLLGIQLRSAPIRERQGVVMRSAMVRLVAAPLVAWLLCSWIGIVGTERDVLVLQAGMPTAVMAAVLATEFDTAPRLVATAIFFSTLFSMITLSVVIWFLAPA